MNQASDPNPGLRSVWKRVCDFFAEVPGSLKNHLNAEELARVSITALSAGGGVFGLLQAVMLGAGAIFPAPGDSALAAAILAAILEALRRLGQGKPLPPACLKALGPVPPAAAPPGRHDHGDHGAGI